jgi:hypothetical protein
MSTEYEYNDITNRPNLGSTNAQHEIISGIHYDVPNSDMTDKSIEGCRWDEDGAHLSIWFANALSAGDKTKLDTIVTNNS